MIAPFLSLLVAFALTLFIMPLVIKLTRKLKMKQTILHYVDNHMLKSGTPTMGGVGFLIAIVVTSLIFSRGSNTLLLVVLAVTLGYGIIGFLDDFIKIAFKQNKGLSPYQKIFSQLIIAIVVSLFAYYNEFVGTSILLPFGFYQLDLGILAVPLFILVFLGFTNSVNLTDGLDGLASNVTIIYTLFFAMILYFVVIVFNIGGAVGEEYANLLTYSGALMGALIGFLCFNTNPAKIFMGDTGALALGGGLASLAIVTKLSIFVPLLGIIYMITSISVIVQVVYFKLTKKRIFLMAPLHHHFERKGVVEGKIVVLYSITSFVMGVIVLLAIILSI